MPAPRRKPAVPPARPRRGPSPPALVSVLVSAAPDYDPQAFADEVNRVRARLAPLLPDMDPGDLLLILQSMLRPFGTGRRFFLRRQGDYLVP